jgi:hypothetical protein
VQTLPQAWTTPLLDAVTDGSQIVWSKGGGDSQIGAPDLWTYAPGDDGPKLVYRGVNRDAQLMPIAVSHGKYAFEESFSYPDGSTGWSLWLMESMDSTPVLVDSSLKDPHDLAAPAVWISLTRDRLIWNALHQSAAGPHFYLRDYEFADSTTRNLADSDATQTQYWFPDADDSGRLVYSTVENTSGTTAFHVYFAQLGSGPFHPRRLDSDGYATEPVLSGGNVVWKTTDGNVGNPGQLIRYSLSTGSSSPMPMDGLSISNETAGNRFVTGWTDHTLFELYDLKTNSTVVVERHDPTAPEGVVRPYVGGDMVVFVRILDASNANLQLCWLRLSPG